MTSTGPGPKPGLVLTAGMSVGIWEITTDIGIPVPVFRSLIAEGHRGPALMMGSAEGMGCHPDRGVALLRALTEAAQDRLAVISGARDEPGARDYSSQEREPDLRPGQAADPAGGPAADLGGGPARDFGAAPTFGSDSSDADVEWELGRLRSSSAL